MIIQSNSLRIDQILKFNSFLIYGPNIGKVDDILRKIVGILKTDWNKELSLIPVSYKHLTLPTKRSV